MQRLSNVCFSIGYRISALLQGKVLPRVGDRTEAEVFMRFWGRGIARALPLDCHGGRP